MLDCKLASGFNEHGEDGEKDSRGHKIAVPRIRR
jgi:hypothetical protein